MDMTNREMAVEIIREGKKPYVPECLEGGAA